MRCALPPTLPRQRPREGSAAVRNCPDLFEADEAQDLPPRSALYRLEPADAGTALHESLLSYLHRLAARHCLRVRDLMIKFVLPRTQIREVSCGHSFSTDYAKTINGFGKYATDVSAALNTLTGRDDLQRCTFIPWRDLLDPKGGGLLEHSMRWCPSCLAQNIDRSEPCVYPLLWSCRSVTHCPVHASALVNKCFRCSRPQRVLSDTNAYGRCWACSGSLGARTGLWEESETTPRQLFDADAVSKMIATGAVAPEFATIDRFSQNLQQLCELHGCKSGTEFARRLSMDFETMRDWLVRGMRPTLTSFLEVAFRLNLDPVQLLSEQPLTSPPPLRTGEPPRARQFHRLSREDMDRLMAEMAASLDVSDRYLDATDLAEKFGTSVAYIRYQCGDLYRAFAAHRTEVMADLSRKRLDALLHRTESVVRALVTQNTVPTRRGIYRALEAEGITMKDPRIRKKAFETAAAIRQTARPADLKTTSSAAQPLGTIG